MGRPLKKSFFGSPATAGAQVLLASARIAGQSAAAGYYIVRQVGTGRYQVTNGTLTGVVRLVAAGTLQEGEAHCIVKPYGESNEYARVIHNRSVKTWSGKSYSWSTVAATAAGQADIAGTFAKTAPFTLVASFSGNTFTEGQTATSTVTPTGNTGSVTYTYVWMLADTSNGTYTPIAGQTASTLVLTAPMVGKYYKVQITGTDANGDTAVGLSAARGAIVSA